MACSAWASLGMARLLPGAGLGPRRGGGSQISASLPQVCDKGHQWGSLTPNSPSDWVLACPRQATETSPGALPAPPGCPPGSPQLQAAAGQTLSSSLRG